MNIKIAVSLYTIILLPTGFAWAEEVQVPNCTVKNEKMVALTFDDGPSSITTPAILKILKKYNAKATFFVVGQNAAKQTSLMAEIRADGHELGNHSFSHPQLTRVSADKVRGELSSTSRIIVDATGKAPVWFRPPYGSINKKVRQIASDLGLKTILWTEDPRDWSRSATPDSIERKVFANLRGGSVVLLHDNHQATIDALPAMLDRMQQQGYTFVTINDLKTEEHNIILAKSSVCRQKSPQDIAKS